MTQSQPHLVLGLIFSFFLTACSHSQGSGTAPRGDAAPAKAGQREPQKTPVPSQRTAPGGAISFRSDVPKGQRVAILAGGCFWGMEEILRKIPGVVQTHVGYTGGHKKAPRYEDLKGGGSGHAEAVKVVFDPAKIGFEQLLAKWFFRMHDPTTKNRQGNDVGSQYRSAIFYTSLQQRDVALAVKKRVDSSGKWSGPVVTEVAPAQTFTPAESYHQDYLQKNPGGYTCHYLRPLESF